MAKIIPVPVFDGVVFGATGDLTLRKLLPALYYRFRDGQMPAGSRIVGAARSALGDDAYREKARQALEEHVLPDDLDSDCLRRFLACLHYVAIDAAADGADWSGLSALLDPARVRVFYLATAPALYGPICRNLAAAKLVTEQSRVVLEKPIGRDLVSAREINGRVGEVFTEAQTYRIDHFLGKETVQNHLLQLLCLIAMEPPVTLSADRVRDEKLKVLRALRPIPPHRIAAATVRGQYGAGAVNGKPVSGYQTDLGSGEPGTTETFVALKAEIRTWRWANVPFYLRTGKRLPRKVSEIVVQFKDQPFSLFPPSAGERHPNRLVIRLQPEEGMRLDVMTKDPGPGGLRLSQTGLDIRFDTAFGMRFPDAYERLLMDTVRGDATLFMRRDEVEAAWTWVEPILEAWGTAVEPPRPYAAGSWADCLHRLDRAGRAHLERRRHIKNAAQPGV